MPSGCSTPGHAARGTPPVISRRNPLPLPRVDLYPRRRAPHRAVSGRGGRLPARGLSALAVGVETWAGFSSSTSRRSRPQPRADPAQQLGAVPERLIRYRSRSCAPPSALVRRRANWKVLLENYNECYHCAGFIRNSARWWPASSRRGGSQLDWDGAYPTGRRLDLHPFRHHSRARSPA